MEITIKTGRLTLKVNEAAALLGVSATSIRRAISRGQLRVLRKFRHVLIPTDELKRFATLDGPQDSHGCSGGGTDA